jgi:ribonuclease D
MVEKMSAPAIMVTDPPSLLEAVAQLSSVDAIALDTEFIRTDTFYPRLALVQFCDGVTTWLIDPLAFTDNELEPLVGLLSDEGVIKVIHSCSEDLEVLQYALGVLPRPLFDTQVAAAFVGLGFSLGYQSLVKEITDVELSKHETRSDWLQRPLSESQLRYAAEDVHYLGAIYEKLNEKLTASGRLDWLQEDMRALLAGAELEAPVEQYYSRVKGAWKLDRQSLGILKSLCTWREVEARELDRPRGRIVADKDLLQIALSKPRDKRLLSGRQSANGEGIHSRAARVYGDKIVALVAESLHADPALYPEVLPKPVPREQGGTLKTCKKIVRDRATALAMAPEMLARKADLTYLLHGAVAGEAKLSSAMENSWRKSIIGDQLLAFLNKNSN